MVEPGSEAAPERFHMTITAGGPYLVFGHPPLRQQFMLPNRDGEIWYFQAGEKYSTESEPTALCRCGHSGDKPYCDGSHVRADWDPSLTASEEPLLDGAERYEGPEVALTDNRAYCAFARFCDAKGQVWNLVSMEGKQARDLTVREADHCPAGRLSAWTGGTGASRTAFRAVARLDRGSSAGQQRSALGSGRHSVQSRGRIYLRSAEPGYPVPLRPVIEQAFLRRVARFDPFSGRTAFPSRSRRRTLVAGTRETGAHGNEENFPCAFL